jgi:hypothetical protein
MKPELSTAHLGIEDRDLVYEQKYNCSPPYRLFIQVR